MDSMVLQCADHLEAGAVPDMRQPGIAMPTEITLEDPPIVCTIEKGTPCFQFADACRCFLGMQLSHPPITQVLAAAHGVGKVNAPTIPVVHIPHCSRYATLGHDGVRLAEKGLRNDGDSYARRGSLDCSAQSGASGANDQNIMLMGDVFAH